MYDDTARGLFNADYEEYLRERFCGQRPALTDLIEGVTHDEALRIIATIINIRICSCCGRDTERWQLNTADNTVWCDSCAPLCVEFEKCARCLDYYESADMATEVAQPGTSWYDLATNTYVGLRQVCMDCVMFSRMV